MLLVSARLVGIGPFDDTSVLFSRTLPAWPSLPDAGGASDDAAIAAIALGDADERPRPVTVVIGGPCSGKTSLLAAVASTRPGHAVAQLTGRAEAGAPGHVVTEWHLGDDDAARPHPLRVASPNAKTDEGDDLALVRRREQALYDRRAGEGGFALVAFSGARWFSRTPVTLTTPDRTILRYDVRATASFDDASRADLTRETKQAVAFAAVGAALAAQRAGSGDAGARLSRFQASMVAAVSAVLDGTGFAFDGVDPARLEPVFLEEGGGLVLFDDLPRGLRHAVAFAALPLRALCAAYPDKDPRSAEGVVLLDDAEVQLPLAHQRTLVPRLRRALPGVQWIVTTASPAVAEGAELGDVIALRRLPGSAKVEIYDGASAVLH